MKGHISNIRNAKKKVYIEILVINPTYTYQFILVNT